MRLWLNLLLPVLATTGLTNTFQPLSEQQRLNQGKSRSPGTFGDASFDEFVVQVIHAYHVPGLSLAVIDNGHISAKVYSGAWLDENIAC
jgi:CubicO group peptidase (beta-lactamase class C family)